jgi:imidazolonepropionase-like amidohydrolase
VARTLRIAIGVVALLLLAVVVLWVELQPPPPLQASATTFRLADVTAVIPGVARWEHSTVSVRDGRIEKIELRRPEPPEEGSPSPYRGGFVLPGLIDLHTHLPPSNRLQVTPYFSLLYLAFGVTSIREVGDLDGTAVPAARQGIESARFPGPRIFACGPYVAGGAPRWPNTVVLRSPEEADAVVSELKEAGFDCVKAYDDLTFEQIRALVAAGKKHDLPVIGHVPTSLAYERSGVPEVQHFLGVPEPASLDRDHLLERLSNWEDVDDARLDRIVDATLALHIVNTPTLVFTQQLLLYEDYEATSRDPTLSLMPRMYRDGVWHPVHGLPYYRGLSSNDFSRLRDALAKKKKLLRLLHRAGARLQMGTDTPAPFVVPGASLQLEMQIFHEAGMTPEEVWAIATWKAGRALGEPLLGSLQAGAPADLLVFREDPTRDLRAMDTLEAVVVQGHLYPKETLDAKVEAYQRHFEGAIVAPVSVLAARMLLPRMVQRDY